jgi:hypothetical protein
MYKQHQHARMMISVSGKLAALGSVAVGIHWDGWLWCVKVVVLCLHCAERW